MAELLVQIDGRTVPLGDCEWVFFEPCGCPLGVMSPTLGETVAYDEDTAWREFFGDGYKRSTDATVKRERKRGVTSELMTHERYAAEVNPKMRGKLHKPGEHPTGGA